MQMRKTMAFGAVALLSIAGACAGNDSTDSSESSAPAESPAVTVADFAFGPKEISVKTGGTVTWTNKDEFDHSIQIDSIELKGPNFGPPSGTKTFSHQFTKSGTYPYICGVHNSMTGTAVVTS